MAFISVFLFSFSYALASLSCSITTAAACSGTPLLRMSGSSNAHAELPSQSTAVYSNNVVCCTGISGMGNSCSGNYAVIARLSGLTGTNSHVEQNSQTNTNYNTEKACLSSSSVGDQITIGYQSTNCTGFDTTLFSMSSTPTNSMVGIPTTYSNKVCAKIVSESLSFDINNSSVGFGNLTPLGLRYATADGVGSSTEAEAYSINVNTNSPSGYVVYMRGDPPKNSSNGSYVINAIGGTNTTPTPGTKEFGIRAVASGGSGAVVAPYNGTGFAYDASGTTFTTIAQETSGDGVTTNYSVRSVATIDSLLDPGTYSTSITYIVTAGF